MSLKLEPNTGEPDEIYQAIIDMHSGLSDEASAAANARLILILCNHIGDAKVIHAAAKLARESQ